MKRILMILIIGCLFLGNCNIAVAGTKNICLQNKGIYLSKLLVYAGTKSSHTQVFDTGDVLEGHTKCVQIPDTLPSIEIVAQGEAMGKICDVGYDNVQSLPATITVITKGTIFNPNCEFIP